MRQFVVCGGIGQLAHDRILDTNLFIPLQLLEIGNKIGNIVFTKKILFIKDFRQQASEFFAVVGAVPLMKKPWFAGNTVPEDIYIREGLPVDTLGKILLGLKKRR